MAFLNDLSSVLYRGARLTRDARAVERSVETGSPGPILKRLVRKGIWRGLARALDGRPR